MHSDGVGQNGATAGGYMPQAIVLDFTVCEEGLRLLGYNGVHENLAGIWDREEPTEAPGALLGRTYGGSKDRGVVHPPVKDGAGGYPGGPISPHHIRHSG